MTTLPAQHSNTAQRLRTRGATYAEIAAQLNISISSAYRAAKTVSKAKTVSNAKTHPSIERAALQLRQLGYTYADIADSLVIPNGTAWRCCNREQARGHARDSTARYVARGKTAIADIRPARLWLVMNQRCA
jgi:DNA-directed RNA polymerase specialized sigma24 family protein